MTQHTPGPWRTHKPGTTPDDFPMNGRITTERSVWIADVMGLNEECEANARLIAAAPDSLAACKLLLDVLERMTADTKGEFAIPSDDLFAAMKTAHAAIAKAETP